ncbi:peptidylprolyl isomerase [Robiginitalea sp. IMCC44478]|uniref:peptidylprolyl isomerase n=1 Tax=Robiginitalea sp. IMCC44478 TaxID=3459122 RepID=UPI0040426D67
MKNTLIVLLLALGLFSACKSKHYAEMSDGIYAELQTNKGDIVIRLEHDKTPVTVANFVSLAEGNNPFVSEEFKDKPYYNGLTFHRVMKDFMIQGGDPLANGSGNPGYRFKDEFVDSLTHSGKGIVSMANGGPKTNGSQFFITHTETPWLDGRHTVFGEVVEGIDVVDSIAAVPVGEGNKPLEPVVMEEVEIVRKGKEAKNFDAVQIMKDYFAEEEALEAERQKMMSAFVAELQSQKEQATALPSGLKYLTLQEGSGPKPAIGDKVIVNYAGWLENGTLFDTSVDSIARTSENYSQLLQMHRGVFQPSLMDYSTESRLIAGFKEGLLNMKVGDKYRLFIPPHLGYGEQGSGPIPPNSTMVFDVEILEIQE